MFIFLFHTFSKYCNTIFQYFSHSCSHLLFFYPPPIHLLRSMWQLFRFVNILDPIIFSCFVFRSCISFKAHCKIGNNLVESEMRDRMEKGRSSCGIQTLYPIHFDSPLSRWGLLHIYVSRNSGWQTEKMKLVHMYIKRNGLTSHKFHATVNQIFLFRAAWSVLHFKTVKFQREHLFYIFIFFPRISRKKNGIFVRFLTKARYERDEKRDNDTKRKECGAFFRHCYDVMKCNGFRNGRKTFSYYSFDVSNSFVKCVQFIS